MRRICRIVAAHPRWASSVPDREGVVRIPVAQVAPLHFGLGPGRCTDFPGREVCVALLTADQLGEVLTTGPAGTCSASKPCTVMTRPSRPVTSDDAATEQPGRAGKCVSRGWHAGVSHNHPGSSLSHRGDWLMAYPDGQLRGAEISMPTTWWPTRLPPTPPGVPPARSPPGGRAAPGTHRSLIALHARRKPLTESAT